jgi:dienelactone hydrolase
VMVMIILGLGLWIGPYALRVQHFNASPADGYHADFYLYVPSSVRDGGQVTILVQPNNSGINADDPEVHRKDAWWTVFERKSIADDLGVILLVPAFIRPGEDSHIYTHALDRDSLTTEREDIKRIDLQLIAMIDHARDELANQGIKTEEKILIQGFSASAMFANRFTMLHPERVKAATIGSPGGWPIAPVAAFEGYELNYPAGIADLESLTGNPFDSIGYQAVPQLIYMGAADNNDSLDFTDGWDEADAQIVDTLFGADPLSRWDDAQAIYLESGANAEFLLVDGVGHDRKALQGYSTEFFRKILNNE